MLKTHRRIEKLESRVGLSDRTPTIVHQINFIDSDGKITRTMVVSHGPKRLVPHHNPSERYPKEVE
jgi:hypothetical protein